MARKRREEVERNLEAIRRLLRLHHTPFEIQQQTGMNQRTVYHYIQRIREENSEKLRELRLEGFTNDIMMSIESYEEQIRQLTRISQEAKSDFAKIQAISSIVDIETLILNVKGYIPKILEAESVAKRTREALELDANQYSISDITTTSASEKITPDSQHSTPPDPPGWEDIPAQSVVDCIVSSDNDDHSGKLIATSRKRDNVDGNCSIEEESETL